MRRFQFCLIAAFLKEGARRQLSLLRKANLKNATDLADALLMTILPQTFLALVRCHFMALALLSAWHNLLWLIVKLTPILSVAV